MYPSFLKGNRFILRGTNKVLAKIPEWVFHPRNACGIMPQLKIYNCHNNFQKSFIGQQDDCRSYLIQACQIRNHSIFSRRDRKDSDHGQPWHNDPTFMEDASPEEKEIWLKSMLANDRFKQDNVTGKYEIDHSGIRIDSGAYLFVLKALSASAINSAPQKCEEILSKLERKFDAARHMYDIEIARGQNMNQQNMDTIREIFLDLKPTTECYNEVIRAWSKAHKPIIARAERWLDTLRHNRNYLDISLRESDEMNQDNHDLDIIRKAIASSESYNLFLNVVSKGTDKKKQRLIANAEKAKTLLGEMMTLYDNTKDSSIQPNTESFNYVLRKFEVLANFVALSELS